MWHAHGVAPTTEVSHVTAIKLIHILLAIVAVGANATYGSG